LQSQSWEYASEMVLKSVHMRLKTTEVPVSFLKDRDGRLSHHKRAGWWSPFQAAWINLRAMFVYGVEFFAFRPGIVMLAAGLALTLPLGFGPLQIGTVHLSLYSMLLGMTLTLLGLQSFFVGCLSQVLHDYSGVARRRWLKVFPYTRTVTASAAAFAIGVVLAGLLVVDWARSGLALGATDRVPYLSALGLLLIVASFMSFTFVLILHALAMRADSIYGTDG